MIIIRDIFVLATMAWLVFVVWSCGKTETRRIQENCSVANYVITCPDGTSTELPSGPKGDSGPVGKSCTVAPAEGGALLTCENGTAVLIKNGTPGTPGSDGRDYMPAEVFTVTEIITPCPNAPFPEVLLRVGGQLLAHYSDGVKQHLTILKPGVYRTTQNGNDCNFTVNSDLSVEY